jgi:hypothetical protein
VRERPEFDPVYTTLPNLEKRAAARKSSERLLRESEVEGHYVGTIKDQRGLPLKFASPGRRGVPDRLSLFNIPEEHRAIVERYVRFAEIKRPGEEPRPDQLREHQRLRDMGFRVDVFDTKESIDESEKAAR